MRGERAWRARGVRPRRGERRAERFLDLAHRDPAGPQQRCAPARKIDDGGFDADACLATVEHALHRGPELAAHVIGGRRRDAAMAVGGRRGDAAAEAREQLLRQRVRRHAQRHRVLAAGHDVAHPAGARKNERERPRPELARKRVRCRGHFARPVGELHGVGEVHDHRVRRGAALGLEDLAHGGGVSRIGTEAVHGLGRKRDQSARAQHAYRVVNVPGPGHAQ